MIDDGRMMLDGGFWIRKDKSHRWINVGCWENDVGCWIEKDKKTQRDDGGFFTLIKKRLSY